MRCPFCSRSEFSAHGDAAHSSYAEPDLLVLPSRNTLDMHVLPCHNVHRPRATTSRTAGSAQTRKQCSTTCLQALQITKLSGCKKVSLNDNRSLLDRSRESDFHSVHTPADGSVKRREKRKLPKWAQEELRATAKQEREAHKFEPDSIGEEYMPTLQAPVSACALCVQRQRGTP